MRPNLKDEQQSVINFNARCPVGTECIVWTGARIGEGFRTTTRSEAQMLSGHTAVVWVNGKSSCISLTHVDPIINGIRTIKTLSLLQPWASLIVVGAKKYETRSWKTDYRGTLAIHASKGDGYLDLCGSDLKFRHELSSIICTSGGNIDTGRLPRGKVLCIVDLVDCIRTEDIRAGVSARELGFGDYGTGRWAWKLANVRPLVDPQVARGFQSLWDWEVLDASLIFAGEELSNAA